MHGLFIEGTGLPAACLERLTALDNIIVLGGLSPDQLAHLAKRCGWRNVERGQVVFDGTTDSADVFFLCNGRVRVTFFGESGREVAFRDLNAGESFGELSAIDGLSRSASVVALEASTLASMTGAQFWALLESQPRIAANVLRRFAALIRDLSTRVVDTTMLTVPERVRLEIIRKARFAGVVADKATICEFPTHADLANQIGGTREAVTKELNRLTREKTISRNGRDLVVTSLQALLVTLPDRW